MQSLTNFSKNLINSVAGQFANQDYQLNKSCRLKRSSRAITRRRKKIPKTEKISDDESTL